MAEQFKQYLCISSTTDTFGGEAFKVTRVSWKDVSKVTNFSDYDGVVVNITQLRDLENSEALLEYIDRCFDVESWADILAHGGLICVIGDPDLELTAFQGARRFKPLEMILDFTKDARPFEYNRINHATGAKSHLGNAIRKYLDMMKAHDYSLAQAVPSQALERALSRNDTRYLGSITFAETSYRSFLGICFRFRSGIRPTGNLVVLPPTGRGSEEDDHAVLRDFFGIGTTVPAPAWINALKLPGQSELEDQLSSNGKAILALQGESAKLTGSLRDCKRWFRLLYDDGDSLEEIVKESLELLGASVEKKSKEKDDYRIKVAGYPEGVMEVKGTHNPKFHIGPLRQLTHWVDDVEAAEQVAVKGMFVGNASRKGLPQTRENLFEPNGEEYAKRKSYVILRSMDLLCFVVLKLIGSFDSVDFWKRFYGCNGSFDAGEYWSRIPIQFNFGKAPT